MAVRYQDLGQGIYCIDTTLYRHHMAACYLVRQDNQVAFIDTGTYHTIPLLMELLTELGLTPADVQYVIPTHVHLDHGGGAGELMAHCPNATLVVHPKGAQHMIDPSKLQASATVVYGEEGFKKDYGKLIPVPVERILIAEDGLQLDLNGRFLGFYDTPGHANHHGCIFDAYSSSWFTGDTFGISYREFDTDKGPWLFAPTTPVAFSPIEWFDSIEKLESFQPAAMQLTHYGRVKGVPALAERLRASIKSLVEIAYPLLDKSENRIETLRKQILKTWLEEIVAHGCILSVGDIKDLLAVDAELNAQGLDVWLSRLAQGKISFSFIYLK